MDVAELDSFENRYFIDILSETSERSMWPLCHIWRVVKKIYKFN